MNKKIVNTLLLSFLTVQTSAQCWKEVSSGLVHTKAIKMDGSLWSWGSNIFGQQGNGSNNNVNITIPTRIGNDIDWKRVSAGDIFTTALKNDGSLWAWGANAGGELGDGNDVGKNVPTRIGMSTDWKINYSHRRFTTALKNNGTLWIWGGNFSGQLGDGTNIDQNTPTQVGSDTDWKTVAPGMSDHVMVIKNDGSLWGWGWNSDGQLGDGTIEDKNLPLQIGSDTDWKSVFTGMLHTMAIKNDGSLWGWGDNSSGELGDGTFERKVVPTKIGSDKDWKIIFAGEQYTLAIKNDGSLWSWGQNLYGELGNGTTDAKNIPTRIGTDNDWIGVENGYHISFAIKSDHSLWAWGNNFAGQLGDGTTVNKNIPTQISCSGSLATSDVVSSSVKIYPNPTKDYFSINSKKINNVQLYSHDGKLVKEYSVSEKYPVNGLAKGIYVIKIQLENGKTISEKIIKE